LAALRWIAAGYGYEITGLDVLAACSNTTDAARTGGLVMSMPTHGRPRPCPALLSGTGPLQGHKSPQ